MKGKKILYIALFLAMITSIKSNGQQIQLFVSQFDSSFPVVPFDTAQSNQAYNFSGTILNSSGNNISVHDSLRVLLRNQDTTNTPKTDTLVTLWIDSLNGFDTINFSVTNYYFTQQTYKLGNNIIVVWPRFDTIFSPPYDTLNLPVYFRLLSSVNEINLVNPTFSFLPNPVRDKLIINSNREKFIDYVRILNDLGQEILFRRTFVDHLDIRFLSEGFYFIEIKERNGTVSRKKFLKL